MEIDPGELLEEMLRRGEHTVLPTLRKCAERFCDIFNHSETQRRMKEKLASVGRDRYFERLRQLTFKCQNASTLLEKLKSLKELHKSIESKLAESAVTSFISRLLNSGFIGLITEENLDFLTSDDLDIRQRIDKFCRYLELGGHKKEDTKKAFEEYLASWEKNKKKSGWRKNEIKEAEREMRRNFDRGLSENKEFITRDQLTDEIRKKFEPIRHALVNARATVGEGVLTVMSKTTTDASIILKFIGASDAAEAVSCPNVTRASNPGWFDNTSRFIVEYLNNRKTDDELSQFITTEKLEPDLHHFDQHLNPWLNELNRKIADFEKMVEKSYLMPKEMILKEVERMWKFLYAVLLNKPELIDEHQRMLDGMIQDAAKLQSPGQRASFLPSISFGQLPLPGGSKERVVSFRFVLSSSLSRQEIDEILQKLQELFQNAEYSCKKCENGVNIIEMKLRIDENVSAKVARCISNLADLQIRGVLVGEFGLGGFRHAMNPAFNRIYSINSVDVAEGFMSTYFPGSLDRAGEPYFCPNGWRRYSIDVGLTASQFDEKYKNWHVAYHGTEGHVAMAILLNGIRASGQGCFLNDGEGAVYLSPSIEYSGHPRYARVWPVKGKYVQMVLQVRVDRTLVFEKRHGTLRGAFPHDPPMDSNFRDNNELEWVVKWPPGISITALKGILVYGIMLRVTKQDPKELPQNAWWAK